MPHNIKSITSNPEHLRNLLKLIIKYIVCNEDQGTIEATENHPLLNYLPEAGSPPHNNSPYQNEYIAAILETLSVFVSCPESHEIFVKLGGLHVLG